MNFAVRILMQYIKQKKKKRWQNIGEKINYNNPGSTIYNYHAACKHQLSANLSTTEILKKASINTLTHVSNNLKFLF
jgi:hypothetical protein